MVPRVFELVVTDMSAQVQLQDPALHISFDHFVIQNPQVMQRKSQRSPPSDSASGCVHITLRSKNQ